MVSEYLLRELKDLLVMRSNIFINKKVLVNNNLLKKMFIIYMLLPKNTYNTQKGTWYISITQKALALIITSTIPTVPLYYTVPLTEYDN